MANPSHSDRRDPVSPVLRLGSFLAQARQERRSGTIEVRVDGRAHLITLGGGIITRVQLAWPGTDEPGSARQRLRKRSERLFVFERPHVLWSPGRDREPEVAGVDPHAVVLSGLKLRKDLFDPRPLVQRIPVETLRVDPGLLPSLAKLPFDNDELEFLSALRIPTPISMILWKRGLDPRHAGTLVVALNLIGAFGDEWKAGDLPRLTVAVELRRRMGGGDHQLLGVPGTASDAEVDRAFRRLSLSLHPDRLLGLPEREVTAARVAFSSASEAYSRLKRSRRLRPVRETSEPLGRVHIIRRAAQPWLPLLNEARLSARRGDRHRARAFALKALAHTPPAELRAELKAILVVAA